MNVIAQLKAWWASTEPVDAPLGSGEEREEEQNRGRQRAALRSFVSQEFAFLGIETATYLARRVDRCYGRSVADGDANPDLASVLRDGMVGNAFTGRPKPYGFLFDSRYVEDSAKMVRSVWAAYGRTEHFEYDESLEGAAPPRLFAKLKSWLNEHGHELVFIDTGGDEYFGLFCPTSCTDQLLNHAKSVGLTCTTNAPAEG